MSRYVMCSWCVTVGAAMTTLVADLGAKPWAFLVGSTFGSMIVTALYFMRRK